MNHTHGYIFNDQWSYRGYIPHFHADVYQFVTFRLSDALPKKFETEMKLKMQLTNNQDERRRIRNQVERWMDRGYGSCVLWNPECAEIVKDAIHFYDGEDYTLVAFSIMPNHLHILIRKHSRKTLGQIVKGWKSFTSRQIAKEKPGTFGNRRVWKRSYFDRYIRNEDHFRKTIRYIALNPERAGFERRKHVYLNELATYVVGR